MHRKSVTSELHDSYFRLMTFKHSISKIQLAIVWALNYYLTQLSLGPRAVAQQTSRELETRCGKESHIRPMGLEALMNWGPEKIVEEMNVCKAYPFFCFSLLLMNKKNVTLKRFCRRCNGNCEQRKECLKKTYL